MGNAQDNYNAALRAARAKLRELATQPQTAEPTSLDQDRENRFAKHDANVSAVRRNTAEYDARVEKQEADKQRWQRLQQPAATAAGGTPLPADLQKLKAASDASRLAMKQPPRIINISVLRACVVSWRLETPHGQTFFAGEFNNQSLDNAVQTRIGNGDEISPEMVERAYLDAVAGNHIYLPSTVRKRGTPTPVPPTLFPKFIWPDEAADIAEAEARKTLERTAAERQRLLNMSFEDLKREARKEFRTPGEDAAGAGGVR